MRTASWGTVAVLIVRQAVLGWREDDIILVARYLNERFYQVRETGDRGGPSAALLRPSSGSPGTPR